jgi:DNA ligase-1
MAATRSRTAKAEAIGRVLAASGDAVGIVVGMLAGEPRQGKIGVGYATVYAVEEPPAAESSLTVSEVNATIDLLSAVTGPGSVEARTKVIGELFRRATAAEQRYLRDLLVGAVRHGALGGVMLDAVARTTGIEPGLVRRAAMLSGDLGRVAEVAFGEGAAGLEAIGLEVFVPVLPMLAQTEASAAEAVAAMGRAAVEWKLDGVRVQVHRQEGRVVVYTRNLNDVTSRVPGVVEAARAIPALSFVLDGEAMTTAPDGRPMAFPEIMSRFGTDEPPTDAAVEPFFFDVLHLDGVDLIDRPLAERRAALERLVSAERLVPSKVTDEPARAEEVLAEARRMGHEGVMVKDLGSRYEAGRRGAGWLKVKPAYTLDLAILAAEWGHGRRTGWLSNLHLGALDPATDGFVMLGKTFKGLTDRMLSWQTERLLELEVRRTASTVYVRPELLVEVAFDGVLPSPRYPAGMALRFARVKAHRPDKRPEDADTIDTVRRIFRGEG